MNDYDVIELLNRSISNLQDAKTFMEQNAKHDDLKSYGIPYDICVSVQSRISKTKAWIKTLDEREKNNE